MPDFNPPTPALHEDAFFGPMSRRFADRPRLADVAAELLRPGLAKALQAREPGLDANPLGLAIGQGLWWKVNGKLAFFGYSIAPLTDAVLQRFLDGSLGDFSASNSFLSQELGSEYPRHLDVDMVAVADEIDLAGRFIVPAWCDRLASYWGQPGPDGQSPWAWLTGHLRELISRVLEQSRREARLAPPDLEVIATSFGLASFAVPGPAGRVEVIAVPGKPIPSLLLTGPGPAPVWLVYDVETDFTRFYDEPAARAHLGATLPNAAIETQPGGDVFTAWASAILDGYLTTQATYAQALRAIVTDPWTLEDALDAFTPGWALDRNRHLQHSRVLGRHLPQWLLQASDTDRLRYALGLQQLRVAQHAGEQGAFLDDIQTPDEYARQRLIDQAALQHPEAPLLEPDDAVVRIYSRTDDDLISLAGGSGTISLKEQQISLVQLSLLNTGGRPAGWMRVSAREGKAIPAWLDDDSAVALVQAIDVGATYLKMLHQRLAVGWQAGRRRAAFKRLVAAQLPLLALELKLRGQNGFDEHGLRLVRRAFVPDATLPGPVVARLALQAAPDLPPDPVTGLFMFYQPGADETLVLYMPLARQPLRQFTGRAQLMDAIGAEPELQRTVLTWLSETAQARYRNGGLQAPHWLRFGQGDEFAPEPRVAPAQLAPVKLTGNVLDAFYDGMVDALTLAADRQTVSNTESFWISARELGWLLFNQALPFFSGTSATAAWLIQLSRSLDDHFNAVEVTQAPGAFSTDELLFDLMLAVFSVSANRAVEAGSPGEVNSPVKASPGPLLLETRWTLPQLQLSAPLRQRLQALAVAPPSDLSSPVPSGPLQGLMQAGQRWLARVDGWLFEVAPGDAQAAVLDPASGIDAGPWLRRDELGRWRLDLRLRLRGGGPKGRIKEQREINRQRRQRAQQCLIEIEQAYRAQRIAGIEGEQAISDAIKANDLSTARERRAEEARRAESSFQACVQLRTEYEAISNQVALPDRGKELSAALSAEANLSAYSLSLNRATLTQLMESMQASTPGFAKDGQLSGGEVATWFKFLRDYMPIAEACLRWRSRLDERLDRLSEIPVAGPNALSGLAVKIAPFRKVIEYRVLCVYVRLSLLEEPLLGDEQARDSVHEALRPLAIALATHKEMSLDTTLEPSAATELLDGVIQSYQGAEDTVHWLKQTLRPEYVTADLNLLQEAITTLREEAQAALGALLKEASARVSAPEAGSSSGASRLGTRRVIRTRNRGMVVAKVRASAERPEEEIAEIVSPLDNRVVARFAQTAGSNEWVEQRAPAAWRELDRHEPDLERLAEDADRSLDSATRQLQQAPRLAKVTRIPVELEELLQGTAQRLHALAERIERALTRRNETDVAVEAWGSAERKAHALRDMAVRLKTEGRALRIRLTKTSLPTVAKVRYLLDQKEVTIHRLGDRVPLKGQNKRKDIVQEYGIKETNGAILWYAHFHYPGMETPANQYVAAHLKTASQRFSGLGAQLSQAASNEEVVRIYRSRIDPVAARELFLSLD